MAAQRNQDIRTEAKKAGLRLWEIGDKIGLSDANFSRMLRKELSPESKARILTIIKELRQELSGELKEAN